MVAIDSNVLIRYLTKDNVQLAQKAEALLGGLKNGEGLLDRIILAEIGYVLRAVYGLKKPDVAELYHALLADRRFTILDRDLVERTIDLFESEGPLSFEDSWLMCLQTAGRVSSVLTFDTNLAKRLQ